MWLWRVSNLPFKLGGKGWCSKALQALFGEKAEVSKTCLKRLEPRPVCEFGVAEKEALGQIAGWDKMKLSHPLFVS